MTKETGIKSNQPSCPLQSVYLQNPGHQIPISDLTRSTEACCLFAECVKGVDPVLRQHLQSILGDFLATLERQEMCALDQVLDLATVELDVRQLIQPRSVDVELLVPGPLDEVVPDLPARLGLEVSVREEEVDPGLERVVQAGDAVGGQEADALVVLELGQEDGHELVAGEVRVGPGAEEDVCLVEEEHRVPEPAELQGALEGCLDLLWLGPQRACAHRVQGYARFLRDCLGCVRLANARRPEHAAMIH